MSASIIDGKELSARVRADLVTRIQAANRPVRLDAVLVGSDRAASIYAENQAKPARRSASTIDFIDSPMAPVTTTSQAVFCF